MRTGLLVLTLLASAWLGGCCCFGGNWLPPTRDDPGAMAEARRYLEQQGGALRTVGDAGPGGGGCTSGLGALAIDVAVAVASRGHAGGDSAAEVRIDPGACFDHVIVLVSLTAGVWRGVRAVAYDADGHEVARTGADTSYTLQEYPPSGSDSDWGSDELF